MVFVFWPIIIAILMVWTSHKVLFKKQPKNETDEAPSNDGSPQRN